MLKVTSQEEFGLRFLLNLARSFPAEVTLSEIAAREGSTLPYVRKLFGILRNAGFVKATKGSTAGYRLVRSPKDITLDEVFAKLGTAVEGFSCENFAGNLEVCVHHGNCGVRPLISLVEMKIKELLSNVSLDHLMQDEHRVALQLRDVANIRSSQPQAVSL